jgi:ribokinase
MTLGTAVRGRYRAGVRAGGRVVVVGSANLDLVARVARLPLPGETVSGYDFFEAAGGKGLNQAVAAARSGAAVAFVGAVGDDDAGRALRLVMDRDGLDTTHVEVLAGVPTGRAMIGLADGGENSIVVVPGANGRVDEHVVGTAADAIQGAGVLLLQHEIPAAGLLAAARLAHEAGVRVVLNPAPARPLPAELCLLVEIVVPNEHELELIGDVGSIPTLVVTEGERGARVVDRASGREWRVPPFAVDAVDTVAAGDAFCGALAASLAGGSDLDAALVRAAAAGALATTQIGAVPSLPYADEIAALIAGA